MGRVVSLIALPVALHATELGKKLPQCEKAYQVPDQHMMCFPDKEIGMCRDTHQDNDALITMCQNICGDNIALTVGTYEAGVDKSFLNMICLEDDVLNTGVTVMKRDDALLRECTELGFSFERLQKFTGDFVGKFEMVKIKQLKFAQLAQNRTQDMQDEIARRLDTEVAEARRADKIPLLQDIIEKARNQYMPKKADESEVIDAVGEVREAGRILFDSVREQMENIRSFKDKCLLLLNIPISDQRAQMADICATNANYCMDEAAATEEEYKRLARDSTKHVGCCCAGVPTVFGSSEAPGKGLDPSCSPVRRLQGEAATNRSLTEKDELDGTADVCLYAKDLVLRESAQTISEMKAAGLSTATVVKLTDEMKECERRLQDEPNKGPSSAGLSEPSGSQRKLQDQMCLNPPTSPTAAHWTPEFQAELPLAPTEQQHDGICSDLGLPKMQEMCNDFCGKGSMSILLGTDQQGFSHEESDGVCMSIGGKDMKPDIALKCLTRASQMKWHHFHAKEMVVALEMVKAKKVTLEGYARNEAILLNEWIKTQAEDEFKQMNIGVDEQKLLKKFAERTQEITGGDLLQHDLSLAIDTVLEKAEALEESIEKMMKETEEFMAECSRLTTGYDKSGHYLLDLCRVKGTLCLDNPDAFRATCCCAYNPLVSYGTEPSLSNTIPGLAGLEGDRRLQPAGNSPEETLLDSVCEMSSEEVGDTWSQARRTLSELGQEELLDQFVTKMKANYNLCPVMEEDQNDGSRSEDGSSSTAEGNTDGTESSDAFGPAGSCTVAAAGLWLALSQ